MVKTESPWKTYRKVFTCDLAGSVTIVVHRSHLSDIYGLRKYSEQDGENMIDKFNQIQHVNIISAKECFQTQGLTYFLYEDQPVTLEHLIACDAYPSEIELASILAQVIPHY